MPATLIDGKAIAEQINAETVAEIARLKNQHRVTPGLAVVLVGENPASVAYVSMKDRMCARLGMHSERVNLPASIHEDELLASIKVGVRPWGMALSPDGRFLYSANGPSDDVSVIDLEANKEIARVKAGAGPWAVAVVPTAN